MNWVICKDHLGLTSQVGLGRPGPGMKYQFRLYDDDGVLYYEGICSELDFHPLDWAIPHAGCTTMTYLAADGTWEPL